MSNWVWRSTEASREENKVSILAIVETLFFVFLTWGVAFYYNFYYYLFVPLILTPFLMLKTPESVEQSHRMFLYIIDANIKSYLVWSIIILAIGLGLFIVFFLFSESLITMSQQIIFYTIIVLTIIFSILYMSIFRIFNTDKYVDEESIDDESMPLYIGFFLSILMLPLAIGTLLRSVVVKILSTIYIFSIHPFYTLSNLTSNWNEQILVNDIFYTPELLPDIGIHKKTLQLFGLIHSLKNTNNATIIASFALIPFWSLAYLYRWSIKSTAWFYWPLAFVFNKRPLEDKIKGKTGVDDQTNPLTLKGHIVISVMLLIYFMGSIVSLDKLGNIESSAEVIVELFRSISINHPIVKTIIQPDTWWLVLSATLIYFMLYGFSSVQQHRRSHNNPEFSDKFNIILHWFIRLKNVLWIVFFAINLFFIANQHVWPMLFDFVKR
ncbi:MAG: hypothetical protein PHQ90_05140 [Sulfuricurvum sp.]|uniref:hypothetical protein n=1 Tax=Sulfuricurvum sp. TaxID=2025608 RepID=UPI002636CBFC|nr:hypothetical protein [Sulfuricurvum sp.]MDD2368667.1 hypothetical protein [Sulfuricurvum sp.]MDD2950128.1 hypothetical protein [Sulfuricurvum sp.]MDD5118720.1 hypothetical protein [Sulfuricurvum sp.]